MNYYQTNLKYINPQTQQALARIDTRGLSVSVGRSGLPTIKIVGQNGNEFFLHSKYHPQKEAERLIADVELAGKNPIIVLGFGLGYHLFEILEKSPANVPVLVIEPHPVIFKKALEVMELSALLNNPRVKVLLNPTQEELINALSFSITFENLSRVLTIDHPASTALNPAYFNGVRELIRNILEIKFAELKTFISFGKIWQENIIANMSEIINHPRVDLLFGRFLKFPAIIISAGPSLDKNIHLLGQAKGKALLIACDTALKPLLAVGISPDMVVSVDAQQKNFEHLKGIDPEGIALVADSVVCPAIFKTFSSHKFIISHAHPLTNWLDKFMRPAPKSSAPQLRAGGSVATVAFDLARKASCDPIVFVGQDLAFSGGKAYAKGTSFNQDWLNSLNKFTTLEARHREHILSEEEELIKANDAQGKEFLTYKKLLNSLRWFSWELSQTKSACINATEGGILEGIPKMSLEAVIKTYCQDSLNIKDHLDQAYLRKSKADLKVLKKGIEGLILETKEIEKISKRAFRILSVTRNLTKIDRINRWLDNSQVCKIITHAIQGVLIRQDLEDLERLKNLYEVIPEEASSLRESLKRELSRI